MSTIKEESNQLNLDDRLKGIAYQFLKLYERWAEDRQVFNKNMVAFDEMLKLFIDQIKNFENLETKVRQQLLNSISKASIAMAEKVGTNVSQAATKAVDETASKLNQVVDHATVVLNAYRTEVQGNHWKIIAASFVTTIITSLIIVFLLIPKPSLPLTDDQLNTYNNGHFFSEFWPKLSKKEQKHLTDLANNPAISEATHTDTANSENTTDNSSQ